MTSDYEHYLFKITNFKTRIKMKKVNNFLRDFGDGADVQRVFASSAKSSVFLSLKLQL